MRHVPVPLFALALFALTFRVAPIEPMAVIGLAGVLLIVVGMVMPWRWPIISAACIFTTNHALALWATDAPKRSSTPLRSPSRRDRRSSSTMETW